LDSSAVEFSGVGGPEAGNHDNAHGDNRK